MIWLPFIGGIISITMLVLIFCRLKDNQIELKDAYEQLQKDRIHFEKTVQDFQKQTEESLQRIEHEIEYLSEQNKK